MYDPSIKKSGPSKIMVLSILTQSQQGSPFSTLAAIDWKIGFICGLQEEWLYCVIQRNHLVHHILFQIGRVGIQICLQSRYEEQVYYSHVPSHTKV